MKIVAIGDSITEGYPFSHDTARIWGFIEKNEINGETITADNFKYEDIPATENRVENERVWRLSFGEENSCTGFHHKFM